MSPRGLLDHISNHDEGILRRMRHRQAVLARRQPVSEKTVAQVKFRVTSPVDQLLALSTDARRPIGLACLLKLNTSK